MTAAATALFALGGIAYAVIVLLDRAEKAVTEFPNVTDEETTT